jgi:hypothetical protein
VVLELYAVVLRAACAYPTPLIVASCIVLAHHYEARGKTLTGSEMPNLSICKSPSQYRYPVVFCQHHDPQASNTAWQLLPLSDNLTSASFVPRHAHEYLRIMMLAYISSRHATFNSAAKPPRCTSEISTHGGDAAKLQAR